MLSARIGLETGYFGSSIIAKENLAPGEIVMKFPAATLLSSDLAKQVFLNLYWSSQYKIINVSDNTF